MIEFFTSISTFLIAVVGAYLLGALPLADQMSRRHGVDIFAVGSGLAGSTNVRKSVGKFPAMVVMVGDMAKGALAVLFANLMGVDGAWFVVPAAAAIIGHWYSAFSGFRGGDGVATLAGIGIAQFTGIGVIAVMVAMLVFSGGQKMPYSSLVGLVIGYGVMVMGTMAYGVSIIPVGGFAGLTAMVLVRASVGHANRRHSLAWDDDDDDMVEDVNIRP
jgi:acyl-phosphate glycerol 3-phosphate acyltransferase